MCPSPSSRSTAAPRPPATGTRSVHAPLPDPAGLLRARRHLLRDGARANELRDHAFRRVVLSIPPGRVSTYGRVAAAAGYPLYHRAVARLLRTDPPEQLPWHRVVGAGGLVKLHGDAAREQKRRLQHEGVRFVGRSIDMENFEHPLKPWEE